MPRQSDITRVLGSLERARAELEQLLEQDERWRALKEAERAQVPGQRSRPRPRGQGKGKLQKALRQQNPLYRAYTRLSGAIGTLASVAPPDRQTESTARPSSTSAGGIGEGPAADVQVTAGEPLAASPRRVKVKAISVVMPTEKRVVDGHAASTGAGASPQSAGGRLAARIASVAEEHAASEGRPLFAPEAEEAEVGFDRTGAFASLYRFAPGRSEPTPLSARRGPLTVVEDFDSDGYAGYHTYVEEATVEIVRRPAGDDIQARTASAADAVEAPRPDGKQRRRD